MWTSALVSWLHLVGVAIGLGSVAARGYFLRASSPLSPADWKRASNTDGLWGLAALILLPTGALRAFSGLEKGFDFYSHSALFWAKLSIVLLLMSLELWPMATLIKWRVQEARGRSVDFSRARTFGLISYVEAAAIVVLMCIAAFMARGFLQVRT